MGNCYGTDFVEEYGHRDLQCPREPILVGTNLKFEEETTMMFQPKRLDWGEYTLSTPRSEGKTFLSVNGSRSPVKTLTKLNGEPLLTVKSGMDLRPCCYIMRGEGGSTDVVPLATVKGGLNAARQIISADRHTFALLGNRGAYFLFWANPAADIPKPELLSGRGLLIAKIREHKTGGGDVWQINVAKNVDEAFVLAVALALVDMQNAAH
ncbi:g5973 [Coccomyxa elongata]